MNYVNKEQLIELVRNHECLYNTIHRNYKNNSYKIMLWEKIGATIGLKGTKAKDIWRSLRDGYVRHKKTVKKQMGASRKYSNFTWSTQMSFLDGSLGLRPSESLTPPQQDNQPLSPQNSSSPPFIEPTSPLIKIEVEEPSPVVETHDFASSTSQIPSTAHNTINPSTSKKADSVFNYLKNKRKREWDSVDHLFMSYAKSFKKLSMRNQVKIKVALAGIFADAEFDDFENNRTNEQSNLSPRVCWSPASSEVSEEPLGSTVITGDLLQQQINNS